MNPSELPRESKQGQSPTADARSSFQWRALTSVIVTLSFLTLAVSGAVLWASPPGRIANWTDWAMLGLRKSQWIDLHIWFSMLFLAASVFHIVLNWRPLMNYFKNRWTRQFGLRREWIAAVVVCGGLFAAVRIELPPFSSFLAFTDDFRESWGMQAERPPIPHAELLTVRELAEKAGVDVANALARLQAHGIQGADPDVRMAELARQNRMPAQRIYDLMLSPAAGGGQQPGQRMGGQGRQGGQGAGGAGWKSLSAFCAEEGIDLAAAMARIEAKGLKASADQTLREIALNNGYQRPADLMQIIRGR